MNKYYFTFGSWEKFPHKNTYMVVIAENFQAAVKAFREKYPDVYKGCLNCSSYYPESTWQESIAELYEGKPPAEVIETRVAKKYLRMAVLLENSLKMALDEIKEFDLLGGIGTTKEELAEFGINVEEVFE